MDNNDIISGAYSQSTHSLCQVQILLKLTAKVPLEIAHQKMRINITSGSEKHLYLYLVLQAYCSQILIYSLDTIKT
jgi:hypothetical protein